MRQLNRANQSPVKDRIEKLIKRGWTQLETDIEDDYGDFIEAYVYN